MPTSPVILEARLFVVEAVLASLAKGMVDRAEFDRWVDGAIREARADQVLDPDVRDAAIEMLGEWKRNMRGRTDGPPA